MRSIGVTDPGIAQSAESVERLDVFNIYGNTLRPNDQVVYPNPEDVEELIGAIARKKEEGAHVALVDGAFDVPHPNHEWYLRHCRLLAAREYMARHDMPRDVRTTRAVLGGDAIFLAVTVDADEKVAALKGGVPAKGGAPRPIYPWRSRAERVAGYSFPSHDQRGHLRPTVDLVTVEGDPEHANTPLASAVMLASTLRSSGLLDTYLMFGEHEGTIERVKKIGIDPSVISQGIAYERNPMTGENWSSSDIIRRAQGL